MKLVAVTQWVRAEMVQVPPDQRLASRSVVTSTCTPSNGRTRAGWSEDAGRVIEPRNEYSRGQEDISPGGTKGSRRFPVAGRQQSWVRYGEFAGHHRGLRAGHVSHRGSSGTWESHLSPCHIPGLGDRVTKGPGVVRGFPPGHEPVRDTTNGRKRARYRGRATSEGPETGRVAVVAVHRTGEGGEVRSK